MTRSFAFSLSIMSHFSCSLQHVLPSSLNWHFKTRASHDHEVHANTPRQHHTTSIFTTKKVPATALVSIRQALMMSTLWRENSGSISGAFLPETVGGWWQKGDDQQVVRVREHEPSPSSFPFQRSGWVCSLCFPPLSLSSCATFDIKFKTYTWLRNSSVTL